MIMKCTFCGKNILRGTGKIFAHKDGKVSYYCSNKCEKNRRLLRRKARETRWTEAYRKEKVARVAVKKKATPKPKKK